MYSDPTFRSMMENFSEERKTTGSRFEEKMTDLIKEFAQSENRQRLKAGNKNKITVMPYNKAEDEKYGTDIMFIDKSGFFGHDGKIRFDVTHAFNKKNNMPFIKSEEDPLVIQGFDGHDYDFHYGIRTGNPHRNFEEPVIVIGFNMTAEEYDRFENDIKARQNLQNSIYEIVNMSNDILQSFYYQADENVKARVDAEYDEDERPDTELITFNKEYLAEAGKYAGRKWVLPEDTRLAKQSRELLKDMVYSPAVDKLDKKYEEQGLFDSIAKIDNGPKGPEK